MKTLSKILIPALLAGFISCKKDTKTPDPTPEPTPVTYGALKVNFENVVDTLPLQFGVNYTNLNGDTFKISKFNYYISNIVVTKDDNSTYAEANSYHLVQVSDPLSSIVTLNNVPVGSYKSISFMLGVDSTRNCSGAQDGDLSPQKNMFWAWNTGYIMLKFEGTSPQSGDASKALTFHIGGYGGANKVQRNFNFPFTVVTANVSTSISPLIHLSVNVKKLFEGASTYKFATATDYYDMSAGTGAKRMADNYAHMIEFEHIHND